jgi:hypothetical protein
LLNPPTALGTQWLKVGRILGFLEIAQFSGNFYIAQVFIDYQEVAFGKLLISCSFLPNSCPH